MVIFLPSPKWKSFSRPIHINQTVKVKCWKRKKIFWRLGFLKLAVKSRDCRTRNSNTSFWSPDKVTLWEPYVNHPCMDVNVESMNWLVSNWTISSCSNMSRCLFYIYSVSYNMKQRAFTLLDLVLWRRYSSVKFAP